MAANIPPKVTKWFDIGVSIAAAVVIYGALQKILHTSIADIMLKIGLTSEAVIFLGYGVLYLIYPPIDDHEVHLPKDTKIKTPSALDTLDKTMSKMLEDAGITPATLTKLGAGFEKLGATASSLGELGNVVKSTDEFSAKAKEAAGALGLVTGAVTQTTQNLSIFNTSSEGVKQFHSQIQVMTKNLSSLNTIYELELQESNNHLKSLNQFYGKLAQASAAMNASAEDAMKAKEQIGILAANLGKLNQVYGNMLTAMQGR